MISQAVVTWYTALAPRRSPMANRWVNCGWAAMLMRRVAELPDDQEPGRRGVDGRLGRAAHDPDQHDVQPLDGHLGDGGQRAGPVNLQNPRASAAGRRPGRPRAASPLPRSGRRRGTAASRWARGRRRGGSRPRPGTLARARTGSAHSGASRAALPLSDGDRDAEQLEAATGRSGRRPPWGACRGSRGWRRGRCRAAPRRAASWPAPRSAGPRRPGAAPWPRWPPSSSRASGSANTSMARGHDDRGDHDRDDRGAHDRRDPAAGAQRPEPGDEVDQRRCRRRGWRRSR